jgi:hypothetical protein
MTSEIHDDKYVLCSKCGTRNSFGNYECIECKEVLSYEETEGPDTSGDGVSEKEDILKRRSRIIRKCLLNIPPFIILLILLSLYLHYGNSTLLLVTIIIFMPWCIFCGIDIYNYKDWHEARKDEESKN